MRMGRLKWYLRDETYKPDRICFRLSIAIIFAGIAKSDSDLNRLSRATFPIAELLTSVVGVFLFWRIWDKNKLKWKANLVQNYHLKNKFRYAIIILQLNKQRHKLYLWYVNLITVQQF